MIGQSEARSVSETTLIMVDDNVDEIFLTRRKIRKEGIVNRFVSERKPERIFETLDELVSMGMRKKTFLILLDVNMPKINGFETLEKIRAHPIYNDVPVLMFSASDDAEDIFESFEVGSNGYIVKPFTSEEFFAAVKNITSVKTQLMS
ncbi:response regulator [Cohaesibacter celericrescens]|uniref:Response regulatory domain-containing protein n=1 Tax=Cohaesibacter celericrescens TaxID=2067669 RepID=A0A2N5XX08_9HYPH|nr:response regulator [Cohaesibacter celericrescens]PLW79040.1 hypothetical protein C0081_02060 [Cohaesibacter celericrescens]